MAGTVEVCRTVTDEVSLGTKYSDCPALDRER